MDTPPETSRQQSSALRLKARIAELEAELEEQREAAAAARTLVADEARRRLVVERELHECQTRAIGVREASANLVFALTRHFR